MKDQDKTKRQLIEELAELRRSEAKWRSVVENAPLFVAVVDRSGKMEFLNRYRPGFDPATVIGRPIYDFLQPQSHAVARECLEHVFQTGKETSFENIGAGAEGGVSDYVTDVGPVIVGSKIIAATLIARDITDRKRAEKELATSKAILQAAFDSLPFDFAAVGLDGRYMLQNATSKANWGDAIGKPPDEVCTNKDDLSIWLDNHRRAFGGEKVEGEVGLTIKGKQRFCHHVTVPIWNEGCIQGILGVNIDITDRKRAEEALQKAHDELERRVEERTAELKRANDELAVFEAFAESSSQGLGMADLDGRIAYVNPTMCRLIGEADPRDAMGKPIWAYHPEGGEEWRAIEMLPALEREGHWEGELPICSRQGKLTPTLHHVFLLRDGKRTPVRHCVIATDISERKQADRLLRESEENLRTFFNTIEDLFFVINQDGSIVWVNETAKTRLDYHEDELIGESVLCIHPEDRQKEAGEIIASMVAGSAKICPVPLVTKQGRLIPAETRVVKGRWNGRDVLFGVSKDISELRASEERFAKAFHSNPLPMAITAAAGGELLDVNQAFVDTLGYARDELIGATALGLGLFTVPGRQIAAFEIMREQGTLRYFDADVRTKDGRVRHGVFSAETIQLQDQRVLLSVMADITDRKLAEEALERERQSLWRMLQASDHERQTISYDIHDGLAQYLGGAIMQFQAHDALQQNSPNEAKKAHQTALELVRLAHAESRRLISGVRPPVLDEAGLETAISHLVHEQRLHGGPKIKLDSDVQFGRLPPILENAIYCIAQEALTNACKHSNSKKVKVTMAQEGHKVRLEVQDWGIGFDQESVEKGHFGLEGIRQRVRLLGGRLTIDSKPGFGTLVHVVVPIVERKGEV